jgi:hypothetical protein
MSSTYRLQVALLGTNFVYRKQTVKFHHSDHYSEHYCEHFDTKIVARVGYVPTYSVQECSKKTKSDGSSKPSIITNSTTIQFVPLHHLLPPHLPRSHRSHKPQSHTG